MNSARSLSPGIWPLISGHPVMRPSRSLRPFVISRRPPPNMSFPKGARGLEALIKPLLTTVTQASIKVIQGFTSLNKVKQGSKKTVPSCLNIKPSPPVADEVMRQTHPASGIDPFASLPPFRKAMASPGKAAQASKKPSQASLACKASFPKYPKRGHESLIGSSLSLVLVSLAHSHTSSPTFAGFSPPVLAI